MSHWLASQFMRVVGIALLCSFVWAPSGMVLVFMAGGYTPTHKAVTSIIRLQAIYLLVTLLGAVLGCALLVFMVSIIFS